MRLALLRVAGGRRGACGRVGDHQSELGGAGGDGCTGDVEDECVGRRNCGQSAKHGNGAKALHAEHEIRRSVWYTPDRESLDIVLEKGDRDHVAATSAPI